MIFNYCPTRVGKHAANFLNEWQGALMVKNYGGYKVLFAQPGTQQVARHNFLLDIRILLRNRKCASLQCANLGDEQCGYLTRRRRAGLLCFFVSARALAGARGPNEGVL